MQFDVEWTGDISAARLLLYKGTLGGVDLAEVSRQVRAEADTTTYGFAAPGSRVQMTWLLRGR
ncbi:MAG: hypothetical protein AAGI52_15920 [Bacteroidota bacterium]